MKKAIGFLCGFVLVAGMVRAHDARAGQAPAASPAAQAQEHHERAPETVFACWSCAAASTRCSAAAATSVLRRIRRGGGGRRAVQGPRPGIIRKIQSVTTSRSAIS